MSAEAPTLYPGLSYRDAPAAITFLKDAFGFRESDTVAPGTEPVTLTVDGVTLGFATCYDVRFPELFRALADRGATAILLPTSWGAGEGKLAQWEVLVRARALDTGCWVLGCGQADPAADLGRQDHLVATVTPLRKPPANDLLGDAFAFFPSIDVRCVKKVNAKLKRSFNEGPALFLIQTPLSLLESVTHAAQTDSRYLETRLAKIRIVHP